MEKLSVLKSELLKRKARCEHFDMKVYVDYFQEKKLFLSKQLGFKYRPLGAYSRGVLIKEITK